MNLKKIKAWLGFSDLAAKENLGDNFETLRLKVLMPEKNYENSATVLEMLVDKTLDIMILKGAVPTDNLSDIEVTVSSILKENTVTSFGKGSCLFPPPYSMLKEPFFSSDEVKNTASATTMNLDYLKKTKIGLVLNRMQQILNDLTNNTNSPLVLGESGDYLSPYNIRLLSSEGEGIGTHSENIFLDDLDELIQSSLKKDTYVQDALSYFLVLNQPESGGELKIFTENNPSPNEFNSGKRQSIEEGLTELKIGNPISLSAGDMVIFRAARLWHQITPVVGIVPRITVGGFISKSKNDGGWRVWS